MQCVEDCDTHPVIFEQPVWQTLQMFIGEMLCTHQYHLLPAFPLHNHTLGFLPVLYALILTYRRSRVLLPSTDEVYDPHDDPKQHDLRGWRILLLWIPAACDLTGTTVCCFIVPQSRTLTTHTAHERRLAVYTCEYLPNDPRCTRPLCRHALCHVPPSPSLALSVCSFIVLPFAHTSSARRWVALVTVVLGVSVVGLSGSMIKKAGPPSSNSFIAEAPPAGPSVLVGVFFIIFAQILYVLPLVQSPF